MTPLRTLGSTTLLMVLLAAASPALAASAADTAAAAALFDDAKKDLDAGRTEQACAKFVEAQRLAPTPGTLLNIGKCNEKAGHLASAWGAYREAEAMAKSQGDGLRVQTAVDLARTVEPRLAKITITPPPATTQLTPGLEVRWDGRVVGAGQWGTPVPVDSGEHTLEVSAPGFKTWSSKVRIGDAPQVTPVSIPQLEPGHGSPAEGPTGAMGYWSTARLVGATAAGVGVVGLAVGGVFGGIAMSKLNQSNAGPCNSADRCTPAGKSLRSDAGTAADIGTGLFVAGGALLAGGAVVFFTAPSRGASAGDKTGAGTTLSVGLGQVQLVGRW